MRGYPILPSSLDNRLTLLEDRIRRLSQPHDVAIVRPLGSVGVFISPYTSSDPVGVWIDSTYTYNVVLAGDYLTAQFFNNETTVSGQEYEVRYYQETPSVPTSYYVLDSGTIPLASSSSTFAWTIDIGNFSPLIIGTSGSLQVWTKKTSAFSAPNVVDARGQWLMGGLIA